MEKFLSCNGLHIPISVNVELVWKGPFRDYRCWSGPEEYYMEDCGESLTNTLEAFYRAGGSITNDYGQEYGDEEAHLEGWITVEEHSDPKDHSVSSKVKATWSTLGTLLQSEHAVPALLKADKIRLRSSREVVVELYPPRWFALEETEYPDGVEAILEQLQKEIAAMDEKKRLAQEKRDREREEAARQKEEKERGKESFIREIRAKQLEGTGRSLEDCTRSFSCLPELTEVFCPPGTFLMGPSKEDKGARVHEKPQHEVTLTRGFWVMTQTFPEELHKFLTDDSMPAFESLHSLKTTWLEALQLCNQLSEKEGFEQVYTIDEKGKVEFSAEANGYRLPTEAEWEYMYRAGNSMSNGGELMVDRSRWDELPEGSHLWGVEIQRGWQEFCFDVYKKDAYKTLPSVDPLFYQIKGEYRVVRNSQEERGPRMRYKGDYYAWKREQIRKDDKGEARHRCVASFRCVRTEF